MTKVIGWISAIISGIYAIKIAYLQGYDAGRWSILGDLMEAAEEAREMSNKGNRK